MKSFILLICFLLSILQIYSQCDTLDIEIARRTKEYYTFSEFNEKIHYLTECVDHFIKCGYYEEALDWQLSKILISESENRQSEKLLHLKGLDSLLRIHTNNLLEELELEYRLTSLVKWSKVFAESGNHTKSMALLLSIEKHIENEIDNLSQQSIKNIHDILINIGIEYHRKGEFLPAVLFYKKGLKFIRKRTNDLALLSNESLVLGYISKIYLSIGDLPNAKVYCIEHKRKAQDLFSTNDTFRGHIITANRRLAEWHLHHNTLDSALFFILEAKVIEEKFGHSSYESEIIRAKVQLAKPDLIEGNEILRQLIFKNGGVEEFYDNKGRNRSLEIAELLIDSKDYKTALDLLGNIENHLLTLLEIDEQKQLPVFHANERFYVQLLISQLSIPKHFDFQIQIAKSNIAFELLEKGFQSISTKQDKLFFVQQSSKLTKNLLLNLNLTDDHAPQFAHFAVEQSKAGTLINSWKQNQLFELTIEDDIFNKENLILKNLDETSAEYLLSKDSNEMSALQSKINNLKDSLKLHKVLISKSHPAYYAMKYNWTHSTIEDIQAILHPDEVLVNYFEGESFLYAIIISDQKSEIIQMDSLSYIHSLIDKHTELLVDTDQNPDKKKKADRNSYLLYKQLIVPLSDHLKDRIIISPSEQLNQIPFSSLRMNNNSNYEVNDLMVANHAISYVPSASIFSQQRSFNNDNVINSALVIAPSFHSDNKPQDLLAMRSSLGPLIFNVQEAEMVSTFTKNELQINEHATKEAFLNALTEQDLIHFSTHAKSNEDAPDKSYLAFYDEGDSNDEYANLLYLDDLSKLYLPAKMVVLSACETGLGKLYKGEGAMSLANACFYAGAQSVVSTLWSVQDKTTFDIISSFYEYLDQGLSKDVALQNAQLDFLASHSETFHHPYYWAGYTVIGNNESLVFVNNSFIKKNGVFILICSSVVLFIFLYQRKKKRLNAAA